MKCLKTLLLAVPLSLSAISAISASAGGPALPVFEPARTALVVTDPQNDFLSEKGKLHGLLAENLKELGTLENLEQLMRAARSAGIPLVVDPLVFVPADGARTHAGTLQRQLLDMGALQGWGAEFHERYLPYIRGDGARVVAPHKLYGPESNDLIYQLRSHGIDTVVLAGLVANLCVDSHMRALMENGFRVYVVKDAVAATGRDAYQAALVNFGMIANGVLSTREAVAAMAR
ncbi:cysteine hydrolase [Zoogloea sp.]|uniref:cysteine hydrolase n=1 Tax=Zoogloea sp. TaxID=49181 RepID=UPI001415B364|nr:MAG: cysteine hydrolase [Zoogloea sp.]